jgi:hypothetical protein
VEKASVYRILRTAGSSANKFSQVVITGLIRSGSGELTEEGTAPGLPTYTDTPTSLGDKVALVTPDVSEELRQRRLLLTACVVPSSPILVTLMKEALGSSETSVLTRATRRNIPEDTIRP